MHFADLWSTIKKFTPRSRIAAFSMTMLTLWPFCFDADAMPTMRLTMSVQRSSNRFTLLYFVTQEEVEGSVEPRSISKL